jgi:DNA-binding Xre family transcriptional regulator
MRRLRIKELAEQRGMTQSKLMRMADLNMKTVQGLYREPYRINVAYLTLEKIAKALDVTIDELFEEVEDGHAWAGPHSSGLRCFKSTFQVGVVEGKEVDMLLIEHKAPHLYKYDAYREYSWSVDQGAYQPASFIYLSFDGFRNLCRQYDLQLIDDSKSVQAQLERTKLPSSRNFLGLITRIENSQDASNVQNALAEGKNVIALVPRVLLDAWYYRDEDRRREALQALIALGISHAEEKLGDSFGYKIWWEEIVTEQRGRLFVSTDGSLSDLLFLMATGSQ